MTSAQDSVGEPSSTLARPGSLFAPTEVDQLPELVHELHPRYPEALRLAGVSGAVELEYVISTDGRVDPESIRVLLSTHATFAVAATEAVRAARFKAARRGGRTVAVLVRQTIRFLPLSATREDPGGSLAKTQPGGNIGWTPCESGHGKVRTASIG